MLASGCIDNQYINGNEKVVINFHFRDFAVGYTTYAYLDNSYLRVHDVIHVCSEKKTLGTAIHLTYPTHIEYNQTNCFNIATLTK